MQPNYQSNVVLSSMIHILYRKNEQHVFIQICQTKIIIGEIIIQNIFSHICKLYEWVYILSRAVSMHQHRYPLWILTVTLAKDFKTCLWSRSPGVINIKSRHFINNLATEPWSNNVQLIAMYILYLFIHTIYRFLLFTNNKYDTKGSMP